MDNLNEEKEQQTNENSNENEQDEKLTLSKKKIYYFCAVNVQTGNNESLQTYIVTDDESHRLTKELLFSNKEYEEFVKKKEVKKKTKYISYEAFETETEVTNATANDIFESLIKEQKAVSIATGNLDISEISRKADKKKEKRKRKEEKKAKKKGSVLKTICVAVPCCLLGAGAMFVYTNKETIKDLFPHNKDKYKNMTTIADDGTVYENGMIVPLQEDFSEYTKTITVSIDRSYMAVPTEDLQIKGKIENGKAYITLPEFDRTDFFTHVEGYTWGFTSQEDGTRIQYEGGKTYAFTEDTKLYRVLVKYGGGSGTKEEPYIINYFDQLELMAKEKAKGYFIQTEDIVFPTYAKHTSINTVNELKGDDEYFEYDGNGFTISNISDTLFGTVSGAMIKNVNIIDSRLSSSVYDDNACIVKKALNYSHNDKTTGDTVIKHCSVQRCSIVPEYYNSAEESTEPTTEYVEVIEPEQIEYDEKGNVVEKEEIKLEKPKKVAEHCIGAISGLGGKIEDCYVNNFAVYNCLKDYYLYVGGVSGRPTSVTDTFITGFSTSGNIFNVGGLVGSASGTRLYDLLGNELPTYFGGSIQGCVVKNINLYSEVACGGIAGEGTSNSKGAIISNCYVKDMSAACGIYDDENKIMTEIGAIGSVVGADGHEKFGHLITNCIVPTDFEIIDCKSSTKTDDTIRLAPEYAYYQENILTVLNKNSIDKENNVFTGAFKFNNTVGDNGGLLAFPTDIEDLFNIGIITTEVN